MGGGGSGSPANNVRSNEARLIGSVGTRFNAGSGSSSEANPEERTRWFSRGRPEQRNESPEDVGDRPHLPLRALNRRGHWNGGEMAKRWRVTATTKRTALLYSGNDEKRAREIDPRNPIEKEVRRIVAEGWEITFHGWRGDRVLYKFKRKRA